jgi:hypothetical protein
MGLIHSRARKKRDRAAAELTRQQTGLIRDQRLRRRRATSAGSPWWRQPTVGDMIRVLLGGG